MQSLDIKNRRCISFAKCFRKPGHSGVACFNTEKLCILQHKCSLFVTEAKCFLRSRNRHLGEEVYLGLQPPTGGRRQKPAAALRNCCSYPPNSPFTGSLSLSLSEASILTPVQFVFSNHVTFSCTETEKQPRDRGSYVQSPVSDFRRTRRPWKLCWPYRQCVPRDIRAC
jgi:hypothetical protein